MEKSANFDAFLLQQQKKDEETLQRVQTFLLLKLQKARELQRPSLIVNAKNLMAEMNLKASPVIFAKAMLAIKKPNDEILFGNASHPGATLTICYLL